MHQAGGQMFQAQIDARVLRKPRLIFTIKGHPIAKTVLDHIDTWRGKHDQEWKIETRVFDSEDAVATTFKNGHRPEDAIALFDGFMGGHFAFACNGRTRGHKMPHWTHGAQWGVFVSPKLALDTRAANCARQLRSHFDRNFDERVHEQRHYPWGYPRAGEKMPDCPRLRDEITQILKNLQDGPDMGEEVFAQVRNRIPEGQKISWIRVPDRPAQVNRALMDRCLDALRTFEVVCTRLLSDHPQMADRLMQGVELDPEHPELRDCYLFPKAEGRPLTHWSVRRPDMHVCGKKFVASENDEMPGGFTDCFHIDRSYGINESTWRATFEWLCAKGPLVFVVSDQWSKGYITSMRWMAEQMQAMGYPAYLITSNEADLARLHIGGTIRLEVDLNKQTEDFLPPGGSKLIRIGTVWRQFPIFETRGKLAELVVASQDGRVRMVPEFAHFGNKSWFALFHEQQDAFREHLSPEEFETLTMLIPGSQLVLPDAKLNFVVAGMQVTCYEDLLNAPDAVREQLVVKITGANELSARSYGVFMAHAHKLADWQQWLKDRRDRREPFIVQERFVASIEDIAVYNTTTDTAEPFRCRVLLRPWVVGDQLVTTHTACTPHWTTKVHGMVDMAVQPIVFV